MGIDNRRFERYFRPENSGLAWFFLFLGAVCFLIGILIGYKAIYLTLFGLFSFLIPVLIMFVRSTSIPTDNEVDVACAERIRNIWTEAMMRLNLHDSDVKEAEPIMLKGYVIDERSSGRYYRKGNDRRWRSSEYQVSLFFFSAEQLHCFTRVFSLLNDEQYDSTMDCFYTDIVSVHTVQGQTKTDAGFAMHEYMDVVTYGGTPIRGYFHSAVDESAYRFITAMKNLLKRKRENI